MSRKSWPPPDVRSHPGRLTLRALRFLLLPGVAACALAPPAHAQVEDDHSRTPVDSARVVDAGLSLGAHDLGLLIGARLTPWLSVAARLEGTGMARRRIIGIGPRFDFARDRYVRIYVLPMFGGVACSPGFLGSAASCLDRDLHAGLGLLGGGEFLMNESGTFSIGVEGGYWWVLDDPAVSRAKLSHGTIAALFRLKQ